MTLSIDRIQTIAALAQQAAADLRIGSRFLGAFQAATQAGLTDDRERYLFSHIYCADIPDRITVDGTNTIVSMG